MNTKTGRVWLVGAGCGSADLITLRGLSVLRRCQAVVYDDLIDRELLSFVPENAEQLYVGKRSGLPSAAQEDICGVLIRLAREGKNVVRLKGGDPFVFGRGGEEMAVLQDADIPCEEIPGISSAIAVPAFAGIPVTYRRLSRSVHIITAHTAGTNGGLPEDFGHFARLEGTLVFLMGLGQLSKIAQELIAAGKDPETPAAVLSGGNAPCPAAVRGPLRCLPELAKEAGVQAPAVIVVGAVAALDLCSSRPLAGLRIGLTGTPAMLQKLSGPLREYGAQVFTAQALEVRPLPFSLKELMEQTSSPWLVFTSGNGVERFFQAMKEQNMDLRTLAGSHFAAVGAATEQALWKHGIRADLRPETYTTATLGDALIQAVPPAEPLVLLRSAQADASLRQTLEKAGRFVQDIRTYDVLPRRNRQQGPVTADYLIFSSAGGVRSFLESSGGIPSTAVCVCIGEATASALRNQTRTPILTAPEISAEGILQAVLSHAALSDQACLQTS